MNTSQEQEKLFQLLRLSLGLAKEFHETTDVDEWQQLYDMAVSQSLVGVCYQGLGLLPANSRPPLDIAVQWASEAETIRGLNALLYQEAAKLTQQFAAEKRRTAILKGQANARLYPDKMSRQPGDIDIWVEGGQDSVVGLLRKMGMIGEHDELGSVSGDGKATASYHHVHLPANEQGVVVEIHFRPASGNYNPLTNSRLQMWLESEILSVSQVDEGFYVPSVKFALVMQLAHVQRHFLSGGIGLRHICDYYWLLCESSAEDRHQVESLLWRFGLRHTAGALMWVLGKVLQLSSEKMLCKPDEKRGDMLLREIMDGGNFGQYAERQQHTLGRYVIEKRLRHVRLMRFDFAEIFWMGLDDVYTILKTLPIRIKYRKFSLRDLQG